MAKSKLSVGAMQMYQQIADYGKNATANTIAIATTLDSATITAIGTGRSSMVQLELSHQVVNGII